MRRPLLVLVAGLVCGVVAVAPAAGVPEQTPKRGGTVVVGVGGSLRCLNPRRRGVRAARLHGEGPGARVRPRAGLHATAAARDRGDVHEDAVHRDVPNPSRCALERRGSRHGGGLRLHPRGDRRHLPPEFQGPHRLVRSVRAVGAKTVKVVLRSAYRRLAHTLLPRPSEARAQGPGPRRYLARRDRESPDGRTDRERPVPSSELGPRGADDLRPEPSLLGTPSPPTSTGSSSATADPADCYHPPMCSPLSGKATSTWRVRVTLCSSRSCGGIPGVKVIAGRTIGLDHLALRRGPGGHPALKNKLVRRALAYGIDRKAIARTVFGELDPSYPASDSAVFFNTSPHYRPNWEIYRHRPGSRPSPPRAGRLPARSRRHLRVRGRTALAPVHRDCRRNVSRAHARAGPAPASAGRCRSEVAFAPPRRCSARSSTAARSTRSSSRTCSATGSEPTSMAAAACQHHRVLPAARHGRPQPGRPDPR